MERLWAACSIARHSEYRLALRSPAATRNGAAAKVLAFGIGNVEFADAFSRVSEGYPYCRAFAFLYLLA
jgi:hypothetical protein